jgi:SRSO17 transposase
MSQIIESTPVLKLTVAEIEKELLPELKKYHSIYGPLFQRREQREQSEKYLKGLLSPLPNKSVESMVLHFEGDNPASVRAGQQFLGQGAWKEGPLISRHWQEVNQDLGEANGVLIVDGSDFPKQGCDSVGVKRQMCGELGKVANCQAGVFLSYASSKGYTLLDRRLYLPKEWVEEESYAEQRKACGVPPTTRFQTKPQLAADMILAVHQAGSLAYQYLTCDAAFGRDTSFLDQISSSVIYFAEVDFDTFVWQTRPLTAIPAWSGRGRKPTQLQLLDGEMLAQTLASLAQTLPESAWQRLTVKEGTKGPIVADFASLPIVASRAQLPGPDLWLVFRRSLDGTLIKYYLSNAPPHTTLLTFSWLSGMRWPIETCFEEGKQELGMGDYQVRSWLGWHHHMTLVMLAHFFLVRLKLTLKEVAPALTLPQTVLLLRAILPLPLFEPKLALAIVRYRQRCNHIAYLSHRKARLLKLNNLFKVSL